MTTITVTTISVNLTSWRTLYTLLRRFLPVCRCLAGRIFGDGNGVVTVPVSLLIIINVNYYYHDYQYAREPEIA